MGTGLGSNPYGDLFPARDTFVTLLCYKSDQNTNSYANNHILQMFQKISTIHTSSCAFVNCIYYMAGSARGRDEVNPVF